MTSMSRATSPDSPVDLKLCDYVEFAQICTPEYNRPELSDRILVFDVMRDGWETASASILKSVPKTNSDQTANLTVTPGNSNMKQLQTLAESKCAKGEEKPLYEVKLDVDSGSRSANESNDPQNKESKQNMKKTQNSEDHVVAGESEMPKSSDISNSFNQPIQNDVVAAEREKPKSSDISNSFSQPIQDDVVAAENEMPKSRDISSSFNQSLQDNIVAAEREKPKSSDTSSSFNQSMQDDVVAAESEKPKSRDIANSFNQPVQDDVVAAEIQKSKLSDISNSFNQPIRQHKIYVHSFWLAVQSPYFRSLFYSSGMKENHEKEVHVKVSESEENAHLTLLQAMYRNDVLNCKNTHEVLAVLELAVKYDLKFVFKKCKYILQKIATGTTLEVCTQIINVIKGKHNMSDVEDLATTLLQVLLREFCPLDENWQSQKFTNLSEPSLKYLLSSNDLIVQSENTVFHALMYWMEENEIDPSTFEEQNDLLAVVRFELVTIDYLYNVIKNHQIASKMPKFNDLFLRGATYQVLPSDQKKLLKKQPVLRRNPGRNIIQYTFVVKPLQEKNLTPKASTCTKKKKKRTVCANTGGIKRLGKFWACGYQMSITSTGFFPSVSLRLKVLNLSRESLVRLKFAIFEYIATEWKEDVFTFNSYNKVHYKISFDEDEFSSDEKTFRVVVIPL